MLDALNRPKLIGGVPKLPRFVAPGVAWFSTCLDVVVANARQHTHNSCFLLIGSRRAVLIDTGGPFGWKELGKEITSMLSGRQLDFIFATHPEAPHMGNSAPLLQAYPGAKLVGDLRNYELYYPECQDRFISVKAGDVLDLGDRTLRLVPAVVHDLPNSLWAYSPELRILFVSDGFPYTHEHSAGECAMVSDELPRAPQPEDTRAVIESALNWTRYVDAAITIRELDRLLADCPADLIAPAHGSVITNPQAMYETFKEGLRQAYAGAQ